MSKPRPLARVQLQRQRPPDIARARAMLEQAQYYLDPARLHDNVCADLARGYVHEAQRLLTDDNPNGGVR
jgi:hypothetical protein